MPRPTLLMIRPLAQGMDFVQALAAHTGKMPTTLYAPVIETYAVAFDPPEQAQYLLFSSVNGVKYYAEQTENRSIPALCVGETTAKMAQTLGFQADSADGTAADLVKLAQSRADPDQGTLLYVCGAMVAHNIDAQLADLGFTTSRCVVYQQTPQSLTAAAVAALKSLVVIPVSSPNTARIFADQTAGLDLSQATFVFISENARAPLAHLDSAQIMAKTPTRAGMMAAISRVL